MKHIVLFVVLLMVATGWSVAAEDRGHRGDRDGYYELMRGSELLEHSSAGRLGKIEKSLERAGATESQIARVTKMIEGTAALREKQHTQRGDLQEQIQDEYNADAPNRAKLERLIKQAADLQAQVQFAALTTALDMRAIVGDEIWKKVTRGHGYHRRDDDDDDDYDDDDDDRKSRGWFRRRS